MARERGVTLVELAIVLAGLALVLGMAAPLVGGALDTTRVQGASVDLHGAVHLARTRARASGVTHALVLEPDGQAFRVVEDPAGAPRTVEGPHRLAGDTVARGNATIRFSPKGFAVPAGTITVESGGEVRRVIVNTLGRVRVERGPAP
jgi:Tfp pilus assembly protein FimT